jgi:hypothetical protein
MSGGDQRGHAQQALRQCFGVERIAGFDQPFVDDRAESAGDPGWPAYDTEQRLTRIFDTTPSVAAYPEEASRRLWQDHAFGTMPLLTTDL